MNQIKREKEQREKIREFDAELFSYTGSMAWFVSGMYSIFLFVFMALPIQTYEREDRYLILVEIMMVFWLSYTILLPYIRVTEPFIKQSNGKSRVYDKLKYLPVSKKQYRIVRMEYLFRAVWKRTIISLIVQCISALLIMKSISVLNFVYVIGVAFALPMFAGWLQLWTE